MSIEGPEPFRINVSEHALADLDQRLRSTRWPGDAGNDDWTYGVELGALRELVDYWIEHYDWRVHEASMNTFRHYKVVIDGIPIHYMLQKGTGSNCMPLVATHGWPWSFWDLKDLVWPLAHPHAHGAEPSDAFDLVVPSLPGFGFSSPLPVGHLTVQQIADLWVRLMVDVLGYERFAAQGGDWGALVSAELAHAHADRVHGVHISLPIFPGVGRGGHDPADLSSGEEHYEALTRERMKTASNHIAAMGTNGQTLAYAMHDSPVGLLAWLLERRRNWSDCADEAAPGGRDVSARFSPDDLITLASIYWHTNTFWSSERIYHGRVHDPRVPRHDRSPQLEAPVGMAVFPGDLIFVPRKAAERVANIVRWETMPAGGHFAAAEEPMLIVNELREMFRPMRA